MESGTLLRTIKKAIHNYQMPATMIAQVDNSGLQLVCGVTAAGKNTIIRYLVEHDNYEFVISHTTRRPRYNHGSLEKNGEVYWFIDNEEMLQLIQDKAFVEVKVVHGTFYGTSLKAIEHATKAGKIPIKEPDVQGALEYIKVLPHIRPLFVLPPTYDIWVERLNGRGKMDKEEKTRRMESAKQELQVAIDNPAFLFIINQEVDKTAKEILAGVDNSQLEQTSRRQYAKRLLSRLNT